MAIKIIMPQLGESVHEGVVGRWLKQVGDHVERDEPLVEIMTDKVNAEIPAAAAGVLKEISVREGQTVVVGTEIALLEEESGSVRPSVDKPPPLADSGGFFSNGEAEAAAPSSGSSPAARGNGTRTSPLVRRLAQEHGIDLDQVPGTGVNGRVTKEDVLAFIGGQGSGARDQGTSATVAPTIQTSAPGTGKTASPRPPAPGPDGEAIKVSPLRRMIAEHMAQSKATVPHATTFMEVDMTALVRRRQAVREDFQQREGVDLTYLPFVIQAATQALQQFPTMNAEWAGATIVLKHRVNIGIAVAMEQGLVVPVIHDAAQYSVAGLARKIRELSDKGRAGKLALEDVRGGTFTVNNPGALGTVFSVPIINAPQAGILTMDAVIKRPVVVDGDAIAVRSMMNLGLAFDHRVNDGLTAARFIGAVKAFLEQTAPTLV